MSVPKTTAGLASALLGLGLAMTAQAQTIGSTTLDETPRQRSADEKLFIDSRHVAGTDFASYRTFAWIPLDETLQNPVLYQVPALKGWIRDGVERALVARGYTETSYGDADFTLAYQVSVRDVSVLRKRRYRVSHGFSRGRLPRWKEVTEIQEMPEGTLVLDIVDPDEDAVVWLGRVAGLIADAVSERGVGEAIAELLERFPPE